MKDQGSRKGTSRRATGTDTKPTTGIEGKIPAARNAPVTMTSKEKIAANQRNKKRK